MKSLITILEVNSATMGKCFERMDQCQMEASLPKSNEFGRIMGHVIASRNGLIRLMGKGQIAPVLPIELNWGDFGNFDEASAFDSSNNVPLLEDMEEKHDNCTAAFKMALQDIPTAILEKSAPFPIPFIGDQTIGGFVAFMLFHESYHIGQMSLIVKANTGSSLFSQEMKKEEERK